MISRRDFMPFGEDLNAGVGNRSESLKYSIAGSDNVRKRFTGYEKDTETGLDFAEARYYNNLHGRFTAVDPLLASGKSADPQTFNRYIYVGNNPLLRVDPTGQDWWEYTEKVLNGYSGTSSYVTYYHWEDAPGSNFSGSFVYQITHGNDKGKWAAMDPYEGRFGVFKSYASAQQQFKSYLTDRNINATRGFIDAIANLANAGTNPAVAGIYDTLYQWGTDAIIGEPDKNSNVYTVTNRVTNASIIITMTIAGPLVEVAGASESVAVTSETEAIFTTEGRVSTLEPGSFARESIPARNTGRINTAEQAEINRIGDTYGCHSCGATEPGTITGNWVGDHQLPTGLIKRGTPQQIYPHCLSCSRSQGGSVTSVTRQFRAQ